MTRSVIRSDQIIDAYNRTGSVWRAAKELGVSGQTVHARLSAMGYPLATRNWSFEEEEELRSLVGHMTLSDAAERLGRPYYGVALKASRMDIGTRCGNRQKQKIPRGAGYDKASCVRYAKLIDQSACTVHQFARREGLGIETLCRALEKHLPDWWQEYRRSHSDLPETACAYCTISFIPSNKTQRFCSRKCGDDSRRDRFYFGGARRNTIGLVEGVCQLCLRSGLEGLSSHHIWGKENDPENTALIALCRGCHQIVGILGGRKFLDEAGWERLIQLVYLRQHGSGRCEAVYACVEVEEPSTEQMDDELNT